MFSTPHLHFLFLSQNALSIQHQSQEKKNLPVKRNIISIKCENKNTENVMQMGNESINRTITTSAAVQTNLRFWLLLPLDQSYTLSSTTN